MKNAAVICEYNPFHNGHAYQLSYMRKKLGAENIIAVMSGNFVQRGEPAVFDKFIRTEMALNSGADLVIEIPAVFSSASAREFARAGVKTVLSTGVADMLCFGTEGGLDSEDLDSMLRLIKSGVYDDPCFNASVREALKTGASYPKAVSESLLKLSGHDAGGRAEFTDWPVFYNDLSSRLVNAVTLPNNILAAEYLRALAAEEAAGSGKLEVHAISRTDAGYNSQDVPAGGEIYASATALRSIMASAADTDMRNTLSCFIPESAAELYDSHKLMDTAVFPDDMSQILSLRLLDAKKNHKDLTAFCDVSRDIADRLLNQADTICGFEARAKSIKTRQYTLSRIKRALMHICLDITKEDFEKRKAGGYVSYIRLLGFKKSAAEKGLLKQLKNNSAVPVITKAADYKELLKEDIYCDQIYYSLKNVKGEYERSPVIV